MMRYIECQLDAFCIQDVKSAVHQRLKCSLLSKQNVKDRKPLKENFETFCEMSLDILNQLFLHCRQT